MTPLADADDLCRMGVDALTSLYRSLQVSPVEVTRAVLRRADAVQARCNAYAFLDSQGALEAARASEARWRDGTPLSAIDGVPTTIKDIVWAKGWTVRYGSGAVPGVAATEDAPAVGLLRRAGAVPIGLTTTPEFGWKALTDSAAFGITRNPWNLDRTPGGSSGGAAVAAATGAGVLHLGTDGGGSIRIPAAFTGVVGHKPTFGRVPAYPGSAFGTVAHIGPIARSARDAALMLDVMSGRDLRDWHQNPLAFRPAAEASAATLAGKRIGVWDMPPSGMVSEAVRTVFDAALRKLEAAGAILEPVSLPGGDLFALFNTLWFAGAAGRLSVLTDAQRAAVDPGMQEVAEIGARLSAVQLIAANTERANFGAACDALMTRYDLLVSPGAALTGFAVGHEVPPGSGLARWTEWAGFSYPMNLAQLPACIIPAGLAADGMPVGLQLIGARGDDDRVLAGASACETLLAS